MFEVFDIVSIGTIFIIFFFLFILIQIEKSFSKPRIYLRTALLLALFIIIVEELIALEIYSFAHWLYPVSMASFFAIYPLIYVYSRDLVYNDKLKKSLKLIYVLLAPLAMLVYSSIIFYPLDYNSKIRFMSLHLSQSSPDLQGYTFYRYTIMIVYYAQMIFYMAATLKLIYMVGGNPLHWRKNKNKNPWALLLVKYLLIYVIAVIIYEIFNAFNSIIFVDNVTVIRSLEVLSSLLFISLGLYIALKQSIIVIQSKIYRYNDKLSLSPSAPGNEPENIISGVADITEKDFNNEINSIGVSEKLSNEHLRKKDLLSDEEKQDIKEAIENYLAESRIYLDPNLKLEQLSKKVHIPSRKISLVVNEVFGWNFNHFINEYRISEVKKMISRNPRDMIIENIYTKVGFNSRSSFNRVFKESTGVSPFDYIKSLLETKAGEVSQ